MVCKVFYGELLIKFEKEDEEIDFLDD